jgi:hypothetical protein
MRSVTTDEIAGDQVGRTRECGGLEANSEFPKGEDRPTGSLCSSSVSRLSPVLFQ